MTKQPSQADRVLAHIKAYGSITRYTSVYELDIFELAGRINDLEKNGYKFDKIKQKGFNKYNEPIRYTEYRMA